MLDHGNRTRQKPPEKPNDTRGFRDVHNVDAIPAVKQEIDSWYGWKAFDDVLLIRYEEFMDQKDALEKIANYLGYKISSSEFDQLLDKYTAVKSRNFNKGTIERYKAEMSASELQAFNQSLQVELKDSGICGSKP